MTQQVVAVEFGDEALGDRIFQARMAGASERACAKRFNIGLKDVRAYVIERAPSLNPEAQAEAMKVDLGRIEAMSSRFFEWTMKTNDVAVACAAASVWCRLNERKGMIQGTDQFPMRHLPTAEMNRPRVPIEQQIRTAIERLCQRRPAPETPES